MIYDFTFIYYLFFFPFLSFFFLFVAFSLSLSLVSSLYFLLFSCSFCFLFSEFLYSFLSISSSNPASLIVRLCLFRHIIRSSSVTSYLHSQHLQPYSVFKSTMLNCFLPSRLSISQYFGNSYVNPLYTQHDLLKLHSLYP